MDEMRYAGIDFCEVNNGKGVGVTLFVQGCPHHCDGCHNPETWDENAGKEFSIYEFAHLYNCWDDKNITRFTVSGGEPFGRYLSSVYRICACFKIFYPEKQLWIYTGYTYEQLAARNDNTVNWLLDMCQVLVDGRYDKSKRDLSLPFRGSSNQRVIDMTKTKKTGIVTLMEFE